MTTAGFAHQFAADVLIVAFAALEARRWRRGDYALGLAKPVSRRETTVVLIGCYLVTLLAVNGPGPAPLPLADWARWAGIAIGIAGLGLRCWTTTPLSTCPQRTAGAPEPGGRRGPYRVIRYPGYLGNLAIWSGAAMASGNSIALITVAVAMLASYAVRISAEEAALPPSAGAASAAPRQTWRLIPFVY